MSSAKSQVMPTIHSSDDEAQLTRPVSWWAVTALLLGLACLLVPISVSLIPISIVAIIFGLIVSIRLSRPDADLGLWMSNLCLGLGLATVIWSVVAARTRSQHYATQAAQYAAEYLDLLSSGQIYNALELKVPFVQRQAAGVDLQAYYEAYQGEVKTDDANVFAMVGADPDQPQDPEKIRKTALERLKVNSATVYAQKHPNAKWSFVGIRSLLDNGQLAVIKVVMQADQDSNAQVVLELMRNRTESEKDGTYAEWRVNDQELETIR